MKICNHPNCNNELAGTQKKYCSRLCASRCAGMFKPNAEARAKMSGSVKRHFANNPKAKQNISDKLTGRRPWNKGKSWSKEVKAKISSSNKDYLAEHPDDKRLIKGKGAIRKGAKHTNAAKNKMSISVSKAIADGRMNYPHPKYISGDYYSTKNGKWLHYRSHYELFAYQLLERMYMVTAYEVEPFGIPYVKGYNKIGVYTPDLLVIYRTGEKELIEVKPTSFITDHTVQKKARAAKRYCAKHGIEFTFWTEDAVLKNGKALRKIPI